jgi:hypothetical protein
MATPAENYWQIPDLPRRGPDSRRRPRARRPKPAVTVPPLLPELEATIEAVARIAAADPARRAALAKAVPATPPEAVAALARVTARLLAAATTAATRAGFAETLVALGPAAAPAARDAVWATRSAKATAVLAGVLGRVGPTLPRHDRVLLAMDLEVAAEVQTRAAAFDALTAAAAAVWPR